MIKKLESVDSRFFIMQPWSAPARTNLRRATRVRTGTRVGRRELERGQESGATRIGCGVGEARAQMSDAAIFGFGLVIACKLLHNLNQELT